MGLKTDSFPTNSRSNKMNPRDLKIKQIVETTRCTHEEAAESLKENNDELEAAVSWILDHNGDNVWNEAKTRKTKKTDAVVEEPQQQQQRPERPPRGESGNRRGGRRGGGTTRGASNNVSWKPGQTFTRTEAAPKSTSPENSSNTFAPTSNSGSSGAPHTNTSYTAAPASSVSNNSSAASAPVKPVEMKTAAGPMSFAAICALGGKKPTPPQTTVVPSSSSATSAAAATPKPTTPASTPVKPVQSPQVATPSTAKELSPALHETPVKASLPSVSKPEPVTPEASPAERFADNNTVQSLTSQLKNDLGLGSTSSTKHVSSPTSNLISSSVSPATTTLPTRGIVEFVSDLNTNKSYDYHFGFNPESSGNVEESSFKSSNNSASAQNDYRSHENDVYKSSNVDSSSPASKQHPSSVSQLSNSYGMQHQQQQQQGSLASQQQQQQQQPRRTAFGYAETSTVSYPPESRPAVNTTPAAPVTTTPALSSYTKPAVTAQSSYSHTQQQHPQQMQQQQQQQPLHQQHTSHQQMYNPMYGAYPYLNLYSPVAGRAEDTPYATPYHMPYAAYGMDVNSIAQMMPQMQAMQAAVPNHHQQQQPIHRADHHQNFNDMKQAYGQSATTNPNASTVNPPGQRDANISSSNVPPPPGFSGPPTNHMFPPNQHLPHMFNYPAAMFMKPMSNQMYGQQSVDDSMDTRHQTQAKMYGQPDKYSNGSNVRERMAMAGTGAQPTPPPVQGGYGGGGQQNAYPGNGQMNSVLNSKKPYHGGNNQWTNN